MKQTRWIGSVLVLAVLISGCSSKFWKSENKFDEHPLSNVGYKKAKADALRESGDYDSADQAGEESLFSLGGKGGGLLGGGQKTQEAMRADKLFAGALDVVMSLPVKVASREAGFIATDWKVDPDSPDIRYRVNIRVTGQAPYGQVRVAVLKQVNVANQWMDRPNDEVVAKHISKKIRRTAQATKP